MFLSPARPQIIKCFIVQKLSQENLRPQKLQTEQTFLCLDDVYSDIFGMITDRESWARNQSSWEARPRSLLERGSQKQHFRYSYVYNIFCDQLVDCFGYSKYTKHPRVQICWRAHIKLHGLGQCNNVPRYLAVFFLSDEVLPSIKLYCITSQGSLRLHATVDLKVPTAECTRTGKPCTLHPHLAPPKEKVVRASALGMPAATKMDEFF